MNREGTVTWITHDDYYVFKQARDKKKKIKAHIIHSIELKQHNIEILNRLFSPILHRGKGKSVYRLRISKNDAKDLFYSAQKNVIKMYSDVLHK